MPLFDPSSVPSADEVNKVHTNSDVDKSRLSQHHTLGTSATQASPGNHNHDGISSVKIKTTDLEGTIPGALPAGGLADQVLTKIDGTDYNVEWSDATAITTTANLIKHYVKNDSGTTLAKGTVVYVSGANGTNILVKPALATSDATTATTIGFLEQTLASNAHGYVISEGLLTGLNTSAATAGDPMWLSGTTAGTVLYGLANEPHAPVHIVYLGTVTRANSSNGEIFIKVNNGWELQELHNVDALTPSNGDLLKYDSATSLWKNSAQSTLAIANTQVSGLGTASTKNIPATGNASATEVVYGTDTRLTNSRTPTTHASTHASGGSDAITIAPAQVTGTAVITTDSRLSNARTPTAHASTHASAGSDPITIAPSQVTGTAVITTDSRLSDARTPLSHTHGNISNTGVVSTSVTATNPVKVLITDAYNIAGTLTTTGASPTTFLRGDGTWATPAGGGGSGFTGAGTSITGIAGANASGSGSQTTESIIFKSGDATGGLGLGGVSTTGNITIKSGAANSDLTGVGGSSIPGNIFVETGGGDYDSENGGINYGKVYVGTGSTGEVIIGNASGTLFGANIVRIMPADISGTDKTVAIVENGRNHTVTVGNNSTSTIVKLGVNATASRVELGNSNTSSSNFVLGKNFYWQPNPAAVTSGTAITVVNLQTWILTTASTSGTLPLPTGTNMDTISNLYTNVAFEWSLINTAASGSVLVTAGTGHTTVGNMTVNFGVSARFASRRTGTITWVTYRI